MTPERERLLEAVAETAEALRPIVRGKRLTEALSALRARVAVLEEALQVLERAATGAGQHMTYNAPVTDFVNAIYAARTALSTGSETNES